MLNVNEKQSNATTALPRGRKSSVKRWLLVLAICIVILGCGVYWELESGGLRRTYRELQNIFTGEIKLDNGVYSGDTDWGEFDGNGSFHFVSGEVYQGLWSNSYMEGYGTINYPNRGVYAGDFSGSQKSGQGTFTWNNGDSYTGEWENDAMTGAGTYSFSDGSNLTGLFKDNVFVSGTHTFQNATGSYAIEYNEKEPLGATITFADKTTYSGDYKNGEISGYGVMVYPNGDIYRGNYVDGERDGDGVYTWSNGDCYDGEWKFDKITGTGRYTFFTGEVLVGSFVDNTFQSGTYNTSTESGNYAFTLDNGCPVKLLMTLENGLSYEGGFSNNNFNGRGKLTYPSGDSYTGDFVDGVRSGEGIYTWASGACYSGAWSNDCMNGRGTYYYSGRSDGYKLVGSFANNMPDGECTYYISETIYYGTTWKDGRCIKVTE